MLRCDYSTQTEDMENQNFHYFFLRTFDARWKQTLTHEHTFLFFFDHLKWTLVVLHADKILISISSMFWFFFSFIDNVHKSRRIILCSSLMMNLHANELCFQLIRVIGQIWVQCIQYPNGHSNSILMAFCCYENNSSGMQMVEEKKTKINRWFQHITSHLLLFS